jgi:hypothetical protein
VRLKVLALFAAVLLCPLGAAVHESTREAADTIAADSSRHDALLVSHSAHRARPGVAQQLLIASAPPSLTTPHAIRLGYTRSLRSLVPISASPRCARAPPAA